jgi:hypothetical protein
MTPTRFCRPFKSGHLAALFALLPAMSKASLQFKGSTASYAAMSQSFLRGATVVNFAIKFWVMNKRPEIDPHFAGKTKCWKEWGFTFPTALEKAMNPKWAGLPPTHIHKKLSNMDGGKTST